MFAAFLAAFANSIEVIADKAMLAKRGINSKNFLAVSMTAISFLSALLFPFLGKVNADFYTPKYLFIFAGIVACAFFYNVAYFYALSKDEVCDVEPFSLLNRPVTIILAAIFFPSERSIFPLLFTSIAVAALIFSRLERKHFRFNRTSVFLVVFIFLISIESLLVKLIVPVISPFALYSFRTSLLAILFLMSFKPTLVGIKRLEFTQITGIAAVTLVEYTAHFYAIAYIGIVKSTLISLLAPVMILLISKFYLKEKLTFKKAVADAIIILSVGATIFIS